MKFDKNNINIIIIVAVSVIGIGLLWYMFTDLPSRCEKMQDQVDAPLIHYAVLQSKTVPTAIASANRVVFTNHNDIKKVRLLVYANLFEAKPEMYKIVLSNDKGKTRSFDVINELNYFRVNHEEDFEGSDLPEFTDIRLEFREDTLMSGTFTSRT